MNTFTNEFEIKNTTNIVGFVSWYLYTIQYNLLQTRQLINCQFPIFHQKHIMVAIKGCWEISVHKFCLCMLLLLLGWCLSSLTSTLRLPHTRLCSLPGRDILVCTFWFIVFHVFNKIWILKDVQIYSLGITLGLSTNHWLRLSRSSNPCSGGFDLVILVPLILESNNI